MNERVIFQMILSIIENGGYIIKTNHARTRMRERGISDDDVLEILQNPNHIYKEQKSIDHDEKYNYRIVGKHEWSVVVSVHYPTKLIIVTVID